MKNTKGALIVLFLIIIVSAALLFWVQSTVYDIIGLSVKEVRGEVLTTQLPREVTFTFVGDVMLARKVGRRMQERGLMYPFEKVESYLQTTDFTMGNVETAISNRGNPLPGKVICFRAVPETAFLLKKVGFDVVSLANNHVLDYDTEAFLDTIDLLESEEVKTVGAGKNIEKALEPVIIEKNGVKIGILAFTDMADIFFSHSYPRRFRAEEDIPGVASTDENLMINAVKNLKPQVDILIVSLHWGVEYTDYPAVYPVNQRKLAQKLVDNGVDFLYGHHPHCIQTIEIYNNSVIAYSLGNFIFDQDWSQKTKEGLLLNLKFAPWGIKEVHVLPILIEDCQPQIAKGEDAARILDKLARISSEFGTQIIVDNEKGIIMER
ncbi:MAG: CapA family protein [Bacillota bacterium]